MPAIREHLTPARRRHRAAALTAALLLGVPVLAVSAAAAEDIPTATTTTESGSATTTTSTTSPGPSPISLATTASPKTPGAAEAGKAQAVRTYVAADFPKVPAPAAAGGVELKGTGSSFAGIEILQWQVDVSKPPYNVNINYQSSSSGAGRALFAQSSVDFGVSDIQYQRGENLPTFPFAYIPVSAGGIAMMYNLRQVPDLQLSSRTICGIFTGAITFWDDDALKADNPGKALPHVKATPVLRGDPAGTNFVGEEYCIAKEPAIWNQFIDAINAIPGNTDQASKEATSSWPYFSGAIKKDGSDGVAQAVADPGSTGYITAVETGYAAQRGFPVAAVKNHDGAYVKPTEASVTAALGYATQLDNGTHTLNFDGAGSNVYNPSSYSYLLARLDLPPEKGAVLGLFANYSLTLGQQKAPSLQYAKLGRSLENFGLEQVKRIPGAPAPTPEMLAALTPPGEGVGELPGGGNTVNRKAIGGSGAPGAPGSGVPGAPGSGGLGVAGASPGLGIDPSTSLDPAVGALGKTGGEQGAIGLVGLALLGGGEMVRRRVRGRT